MLAPLPAQPTHIGVHIVLQVFEGSCAGRRLLQRLRQDAPVLAAEGKQQQLLEGAPR